MVRLCAVAIALVMSFPIAVLAAEPKELAEEFFAKIKADEIPAAYDFLFAGSDLVALKPQGMEVMKSQTTSMLPLLGPVIGVELIREEVYGTSVLRLTYVLKHPKMPSIWQFYFYKPTDQWIINTVHFHDQPQMLGRGD